MFFFKHKTAYEVRISDWSSDVCSSDLLSISSGIALGRDVLDSRTDPAISDFQRTANRAEVVVPMALVPDDTQAAMLARAIPVEVPAHVAVTTTRDPGCIPLGAHVRLGPLGIPSFWVCWFYFFLIFFVAVLLI